ncbi:MAG TPA: DEAD/DEAH box helicase [Polyangia bacterium]|nr:DEAD/DEAH box helicase [Polyangia bacterium]
MRIETLEAYNVPSDIIEVWKQQVGQELLPVQERAVKEFGLFGAENLIVFSPTSSGKTFIGEMAAVRAARANTKVFYLVPQKALAAEKFEELRRRYAPVGISVVVSSRDHREYDDRILRRDFQIAVVVFEKLQALLVSHPQLMKVVGLVVVDELQIITDRERGPTLELLLTKLRLGAQRPRIIGLSAVLGRAQTLADWLGARLLVETRRPVELRKGVLCRGSFRYIEHNSSNEGVETFPDVRHERREELLLAAVEELTRREEQVLAFVPDRSSTVQFARVVAGRVTGAAAVQALEELRQFEETHAREALLEVLGSGLAFHNSDLSPEERDLVERHFRSGAIRCLFSTSTLAVGMNLPVRNVVLDGRKWEYLRRYGRWSLEDISKSEYENMSGRAGRLSLVNDFGRSILVTYSPFEAEVWLRFYAGSEFEDIRPTLGDAPLEDHVLDVLASGLATTRTEVEELLLSSYTGQVYWAQRISRDEFTASLAKATDLLVAAGLVERKGESLAINVVGRACAAKGIGAKTGIALASWARDAAALMPSELEILTVASFTDAGNGVYVTVSKEERYKADYRGQLLTRAVKAGVANRPIFGGLAAQTNAAEFEAVKAIKKTLLLIDWIAETTTKDLEAQYHVWAGGIRRIGEEYGWLVDALGAIGRACGWSDERADAVSRLADRLAHGVREDAVAVAQLRARGVGRVFLRRLVDAGFRTPEDVRGAGADALRGVLRNKAAFSALWSALGPDSQKDMPQQLSLLARTSSRAADAPTERGAASAALSVVLTVNLREWRVFYRGVEIPTRPPRNLQRQPVLALAALAQQPGQSIPVAEIAEAMQKLGRTKRRLVAPDPRDLRYKLLAPFRHALKNVVPANEVDQLVESVAGNSLRLNAPGPVQVVTAAPADAAS